MFRKPVKRRNKDALRQKTEEPSEDLDETSDLLAEARKRTKTSETTPSVPSSASISIVPQVETSGTAVSNADLATSVAEYHPSASKSAQDVTVEDGIFRDTKRNAFHAGPIRAAQHVRVTARFDYQPDICKDYKDTGFCGFGDTCIYLHDRGDTLTGWQLEQQWEEQQRKKKEEQERQLNAFMGKKEEDGDKEPDDGLPFACYLCRGHFREPVVTTCQHYFCQQCIMNHIRNESEVCPVCQLDTHSIWNEPAKLLAKLRRVLGPREAKREDAWESFFAQKGRAKME